MQFVSVGGYIGLNVSFIVHSDLKCLPGVRAYRRSQVPEESQWTNALSG